MKKLAIALIFLLIFGFTLISFIFAMDDLNVMTYMAYLYGPAIACVIVYIIYALIARLELKNHKRLVLLNSLIFTMYIVVISILATKNGLSQTILTNSQQLSSGTITISQDNSPLLSGLLMVAIITTIQYFVGKKICNSKSSKVAAY